MYQRIVNQKLINQSKKYFYSSPLTMSKTSISVYQWVDNTFDEIFFQPDDALAEKSFDEKISRNFTCK